MNHSLFIDLTQQLLVYTVKAEQIYRETRETGVDRDFYKEAKPFADEVKAIADKWKELYSDWLMDVNPKYSNPVQLLNTYQNILQVSVHCSFGQSSRSKFMKHVKAVTFVLEQIINEEKDGQGTQDEDPT